MKKTFTLIIVLCTLFLSSMGQVLLEETFDYPVGSNLSTAPGWTVAGTLNAGAGRTIVQPVLTYSNAGGTYYLSGIGKTMNSDITDATAYYHLKPFTATPVTSGVIYLTFLYKAGVAQTQTNSEVFGMSTGTSAGPKVYVGKGAITTTSYRFGTTRSSQSSADVKWAATEFADVNAVHLVVLKYDFTTQISSIFINPTISSATEPAADITDNSGTARTSLNNLWVRAQGTSNMRYNISGARVSTTWAAAVATQIPKLTTPVVGSASSISNIGFTANWTPVANATGYSVKVYSGATLVNTTNATGQAASNIAILGMTSATTYTYTVTALGDGINYSSSDPSTASAPFTTLGLMPPVVGVATAITSGGFTANWTPVANATGYDVKVYLGTFLVSTTNAPGQATSSLPITGMSFGTSYTFVVIAKGDGLTYLDSSPSAASPVFITLYVNVNTIHTDFGDGTWGNPVTTTPANGSFPSCSINGFIFEKSVIRVASKKDRRGDTHINDITFDNVTNGGLVVFPVVNSVAQIELHAYTGTAERTFLLEEYNTGTSVWDLIGTYTYNTASKNANLDSIYVIPISRSVPSKFRVRNNGSGSFNVAQVITRLTNPVTLPTPVVGVATNITSVGFTANWTPVPNATGYVVFVYKRDIFVSQTTVSGQSASFQAITGLMSDSTYTFKVRANGDGFVNYADSYLSAASAPFIILAITAPVIQTSNIAFTAIVNTGMTVNYNAGDGMKRIVKMNTSNSFTNPADGTDPTANSVYAGSGEQVVYNNNGNSVSITGLTPGTIYWYRAYEYNGSGTLTKFLTTTLSSNPNSQSSNTIPDAVTNAAINITSTGAILNGTVLANNAGTTVTFEYGLTTSYGLSANATPNIVTGSTVTPVSASVAGLVVGNTYHFRVKAVNGGGTSYGNDRTFLTGCTIPATTSPITGTASVCQGVNGVVYSVTPIWNADTYVWTLPTGATITAGAGTNSITVNYSLSAVSGNITVKATNDCGNGGMSTLAVTVNPLPTPTLVTGLLAACLGTTGVVYSTQAGMIGYTWTISSGGTITAGAGTNAITVSWNVAGAQTISLNYTTSAGCTAAAPAVFNITVANRPVPVITGPANACQGYTNNVYTTQAGNSNYIWTVSAGGIITAGAGTNAITVTWTSTGAKVVTVDYTIPAGCNALNPTAFNVNVNLTPTPTISGSATVCAGTEGVTYTTEPGYLNYIWTISYDGVITSGLNTNTITVNWPTAGSRYVAVNYSNPSGCNANAATYRNVTVLPVPVPLIFGQNAVCQGTSEVAYTTQAGNTNYVWTVSSGGTITSGAGTSGIMVTWNSGGNQTVSVNYTNAGGCAGAQPTVYNVAVAPLPLAGGTITGPASVCSGAQGVAYSVPAIANATTYSWTVPTGAAIATGATTNSITVNYSPAATSGVIKVNGVNSCGNGASSPGFNVTVNPIPATPVITQVPVGDTLISNASTGNQWYLNGVAIPGATGKKHKPVYLGSYTVVVTLSGCSSPLSNAIVVTKIVAITDLEISHSFEVYPNPNRGTFNLKLASGKPVDLNIEIYNNIGALLWKQVKVHVDGNFVMPVDLGVVPAGVYIVALRNGDTNIVRKMTIMK